MIDFERFKEIILKIKDKYLQHSNHILQLTKL